MTAVHDELTQVVAALSAEQARQVLAFARTLTPDAAAADESYEWTDEDMRDFSLAAFRQFDAEHPDEDWGEDFTVKQGED